MTGAEISSSKPCPKCGAKMSVNPDFVTWCLSCDYGIEGSQANQKKKTRVEKLYDELGKKQGRQIFDQLVKSRNLQPAFSKTRIFIYLMAGAVHLLTVAFLIGGLVLLITQRENFVMIIIALTMLGLAWLVKPKTNPMPAGFIISREDAPAIYRLVDHIAHSLGTHIDQIILDEWFNASYSRTGWKQKHVLVIGLPLWEILNDQERIAVIAHEIAHDINGDASRGLFVGTAIQTLTRLNIVFTPPAAIRISEEFLYFISRIILSIPAGITWGINYAIILLLYRDLQRAEYFADRLGATVGGRMASIDALHKLAYNGTFFLAVQHCSLNSQKKDIYEEFNQQIAGMPALELERIRRLENRDMIKLDNSHPTTGMRIRMLEEHEPQSSQTILADPENMRAIAQQLAKYRPKVHLRLIDFYRSAIS